MNTRNKTVIIYNPSTSHYSKMKGKNIAACFFSCKIPQATDDLEEPKCYTSAVATPRNSQSFDPIEEDSRRARRKGKGHKPNKRNHHEERTSNSSYQITHEKGDYRNESSRSCVKEEDDYIVFYMNDNGSLDMITENRESEFGQEDGTQSSYNLNDNMADMKIEESIHAKETKVEGKERSAIEEMDNTGTSHGGTMLSLLLSARESTDSIHSDASTSSFTFPVLRWEGTGSPVHMPRPNEGLSTHNGCGIACFHGHIKD